MSRRVLQAFILIGLVFGLALVGPPLALSQITWVRMGVNGIAFNVTGTNQVIPVKSDGALEKLRQAADQEGTHDRD